MQHAMETPLLIIDELGYEPLSEELMTVVDHRYRWHGATTVLVSGLTKDEFVKRYGGALTRRITENGLLVNAHPATERKGVHVAR